jgi:phosphopantothenoylcysteine decarboxylase
MATTKVFELVGLLLETWEVRVVVTTAAQHFFDLEKLREKCEVITDEDEWHKWKVVGDEVQHIELRRWADCFLIAPLSANTMGKLANGLCNNLLTCVARAWDLSRPCLVAPAMNAHMWTHPLTARHLTVLRELHMIVLDPVVKLLACGDRGQGAMASPVDIAAACRRCLPIEYVRSMLP